MGLNTPAAGLRRINYDARSAAKVQIVVQPGDTLDVSDAVADQLLRSSPQFKDAATPPSKGAIADEAPTDPHAELDEADVSGGEPAPKRRTAARKG